jgi:hypothetical protein
MSCSSETDVARNHFHLPVVESNIYFTLAEQKLSVTGSNDSGNSPSPRALSAPNRSSAAIRKGRVFRGKFCARLRRLHRRKQLRCTGPASALAEPRQLHQLLRRLHRQDWVVYAKPAFGGPWKVLRYLGRYTHRIAISNHRLLAFDGERVTFRWKDYAHGGKQRKMTLLATEFLRRFFLHVLPKGFVKIRYFGFLANRFRAQRLPLCQQLLASARPPLSRKLPLTRTAPTAEPQWLSCSGSPLWNFPGALTSIHPDATTTSGSTYGGP